MKFIVFDENVIRTPIRNDGLIDYTHSIQETEEHLAQQLAPPKKHNRKSYNKVSL